MRSHLWTRCLIFICIIVPILVYFMAADTVPHPTQVQTSKTMLWAVPQVQLPDAINRLFDRWPSSARAEVEEMIEEYPGVPTRHVRPTIWPLPRECCCGAKKFNFTTFHGARSDFIKKGAILQN